MIYIPAKTFRLNKQLISVYIFFSSEVPCINEVLLQRKNDAGTKKGSIEMLPVFYNLYIL